MIANDKNSFLRCGYINGIMNKIHIVERGTIKFY